MLPANTAPPAGTGNAPCPNIPGLWLAGCCPAAHTHLCYLRTRLVSLRLPSATRGGAHAGLCRTSRPYTFRSFTITYRWTDMQYGSFPVCPAFAYCSVPCCPTFANARHARRYPVYQCVPVIPCRGQFCHASWNLRCWEVGWDTSPPIPRTSGFLWFSVIYSLFCSLSHGARAAPEMPAGGIGAFPRTRFRAFDCCACHKPLLFNALQRNGCAPNGGLLLPTSPSRRRTPAPAPFADAVDVGTCRLPGACQPGAFVGRGRQAGGCRSTPRVALPPGCRAWPVGAFATFPHRPIRTLPHRTTLQRHSVSS